MASTWTVSVVNNVWPYLQPPSTTPSPLVYAAQPSPMPSSTSSSGAFPFLTFVEVDVITVKQQEYTATVGSNALAVVGVNDPGLATYNIHVAGIIGDPAQPIPIRSSTFSMQVDGVNDGEMLTLTATVGSAVIRYFTLTIAKNALSRKVVVLVTIYQASLDPFDPRWLTSGVYSNAPDTLFTPNATFSVSTPNATCGAANSGNGVYAANAEYLTTFGGSYDTVRPGSKPAETVVAGVSQGTSFTFISQETPEGPRLVLRNVTYQGLIVRQHTYGNMFYNVGCKNTQATATSLTVYADGTPTVESCGEWMIFPVDPSSKCHGPGLLFNIVCRQTDGSLFALSTMSPTATSGCAPPPLIAVQLTPGALAGQAFLPNGAYQITAKGWPTASKVTADCSPYLADITYTPCYRVCWANDPTIPVNACVNYSSTWTQVPNTLFSFALIQAPFNTTKPACVGIDCSSVGVDYSPQCFQRITMGCSSGLSECALIDTEAGSVVCPVDRVMGFAPVPKNSPAAAYAPQVTPVNAVQGARSMLQTICGRKFSTTPDGAIACKALLPEVKGETTSSCSGFRTENYADACSAACALDPVTCDAMKMAFCDVFPDTPDCACIRLDTSPFVNPYADSSTAKGATYQQFVKYYEDRNGGTLQAARAHCWWQPCLFGADTPTKLTDGRGALVTTELANNCPNNFTQCVASISGGSIHDSSVTIHLLNECSTELNSGGSGGGGGGGGGGGNSSITALIPNWTHGKITPETGNGGGGGGNYGPAHLPPNSGLSPTVLGLIIALCVIIPIIVVVLVYVFVIRKQKPSLPPAANK